MKEERRRASSAMASVATERPRRAAAIAASAAIEGMHCTVADVVGVHAHQSIALTSRDVLEQGELHLDQNTTIVTLHTNERPPRLPPGTIHIGAAFEDSSDFDDQTLACHLKNMAAFIWAAHTPRVVFVCNAGVNRSSLALCYYAARHGKVGWQDAKAAVIAAKGGAARGWPTLENAAFESFLGRCCVSGSATAAPWWASTPVAWTEPTWHWRTSKHPARPSTGGKTLPGEDATQKAKRLRRTQRDFYFGLLNTGVRNGDQWGCWDPSRAAGSGGAAARMTPGEWVRGVPNEPRPWESRRGAAPLGMGLDPDDGHTDEARAMRDHLGTDEDDPWDDPFPAVGAETPAQAEAQMRNTSGILGKRRACTSSEA